MKKKLLSLALTAALLAGATIPVMAVNGNNTAISNDEIQEQDTQSFIPSPGLTPAARSDDDEIEVVTDNIVTGGYILRKGDKESRPLDEINYPVIKITTLSMSSQANADVDAANPGASSAQKAGMMTESGLYYGQNASVNETADRYLNAESTGKFVDEYDLSIFDRAVLLAEGQLDGYSVMQIADISANNQAASSSKGVRLTFEAPGVKVSSRVMVARIQNGSLEFITSSAGNGTISFDVYPNNLGTYVLLVRGE